MHSFIYLSLFTLKTTNQNFFSYFNFEIVMLKKTYGESNVNTLFIGIKIDI